nr:retrovirus-related Pol polyprotein from transposon TNT 1-94 [Tanacetum cinerariifolium]
MTCSLPHTVEEIQAYVKKQCDKDNVIRQEDIIDVTRLFEHARATKEDLRKYYVECKDIPQERRALIDKFLEDEARKDYEIHSKMWILVELQGLNNHTLEEDWTDREDGDDEDAGDKQIDQTSDLTDYQLVRDREPRRRTKPLRFWDESNMVTYGFVTVEEEDIHEPLTYQEAVACEDNDMLIACKSKAEIGSTKSLLKKEFNMKELREAKKILGFVDSYYAEDPDKGRSSTSYAYLVQGCVVSWKGTIHLSRNHVFHERTKHINVRYHFIREVLEAKTVKVLKAGTKHNVADALTKVVPGLKLQHCMEFLNVETMVVFIGGDEAATVDDGGVKVVLGWRWSGAAVVDGGGGSGVKWRLWMV